MNDDRERFSDKEPEPNSEGETSELESSEAPQETQASAGSEELQESSELESLEMSDVEDQQSPKPEEPQSSDESEVPEDIDPNYNYDADHVGLENAVEQVDLNYDFEADHAELEALDPRDPHYDFDADHAGIEELNPPVEKAAELAAQVGASGDAEPPQHPLPPKPQPYQPEDPGPEYDPFEAAASSIEDTLGNKAEGRGEQGDMSFLEHLEDLRGTLVKSFIAFAIGIGAMILFIPHVAEILAWPLVTAQNAHNMDPQEPIMYKPMGVFVVILQLVFMGGLGLSLPFILFFVSQFVAPGLTKRELRVLAPACLSAFCLFILGILFSYFLILPPGLYFAISVNAWLDFELLLAATDYYSLVVWLCLGVGALFQFPLVIVILAYIGVFSVEQLKNSRRLVVVIMLVLSAVITPGGDPITFLILTGFLFLLYEASIVVARFLGTRSNDNDEEVEEGETA